MPPRSRRRALAAVDPNAASVPAPSSAPAPSPSPSPKTSKAPAKTSQVVQLKLKEKLEENEKQKAELKEKEAENNRLKKLAALAEQNQKAELKKKEAEADLLKEQIAALSEQLAKTVIAPEPNVHPVAHVNPFGAPAPLPVAKPPLAPKRPLSAFQYYCSEHRESFKAENPEVPPRNVTAELKKIWDASTEDEAAPFHAKALNDNIRYQHEKNEYHKRKTEYERTLRALQFMQAEKEKEMALKFYHGQLAKDQAKLAPVDVEEDSIPTPKRALSAWNYFQKFYNEQLKEKHGGTAAPFAEVSAETAAEWKRLQKSRRAADKARMKKLKELADEDAERYEEEKKKYNFLIAEKHKKRILLANEEQSEALGLYAIKERQEMLLAEGEKAIAVKGETTKEEKKIQRQAAREKKAGMPKGARNAYNFFLQKHAPLLREDGINSGKELMVAIAAMWKELDDASKSEYQELAQTDKVRYEHEMEATNAQRVASEESIGSPRAAF